MLRTAVFASFLFFSVALLAGAQDQDAREHIGKIESCLTPAVLVKGAPTPCSTIQRRMAELHVNAVSVAVVHNGAVAWAKAYGPATTETIFQAGSISKPVASMGALHLVQEGKLTLDGNIQPLLTSWQIPPSSAAPHAIVTLRELLTHTAGFMVHGFPGYAKEEPVPTTVQVLKGEKPANTEPVRLESVPGSTWKYSGGGMTVMQLLVMDVTHQPYPKFLRDTVLAPIGMMHSTYEQPLPAELLPHAALPYRGDGSMVTGGPHTYPEMAAAGLWTTPSDLANYILEIQKSLRGQANHVLSQTMTKQMLERGKGDWGLGIQIGGSTSNPYFTHGGVNEGYQSLFVGYENSGDGAAVMTNSDNGMQIADQVMTAIARAYGWPDFQRVERAAVKLDPAAVKPYLGTYEIGPGHDVTFTLEAGEFRAALPGQPEVRLYPEASGRFFLTDMDLELEFVPDAVIIRQGKNEMKARRK